MMTQSVITLGTGEVRAAEDEEGDVYSGHIDILFGDEVDMFFDLHIWDEAAEFPKWIYLGAFNTYDGAEEVGHQFGDENYRITEGSWY
jgi:hypothetical protein